MVGRATCVNVKVDAPKYIPLDANFIKKFQFCLQLTILL